MLDSTSKSMIVQNTTETLGEMLLMCIDTLSSLGYTKHEDSIEDDVSALIREGTVNINTQGVVLNTISNHIIDFFKELGIILDTDNNMGIVNMSLLLYSMQSLSNIEEGLKEKYLDLLNTDYNNVDIFISIINDISNFPEQVGFDTIHDVSDDTISVIRSLLTTDITISEITKKLSFNRLSVLIDDNVKDSDGFIYTELFKTVFMNNETLDRVIKSYITVFKNIDVALVTKFTLYAVLMTDKQDDPLDKLFSHIVGLYDKSKSDTIISNVTKVLRDKEDLIKTLRR